MHQGILMRPLHAVKRDVVPWYQKIIHQQSSAHRQCAVGAQAVKKKKTSKEVRLKPVAVNP